MKTIGRNVTVLLLLLGFVFGQAFSATPAYAADPVAPCAGEQVSGVVVAVDEATGTLTLSTASGLCSVTLAGTYDHPIVALLGLYFGDIKPSNFVPDLEHTRGCALFQEDTSTWVWADCATTGAVPVQVQAVNEDGTFTAVLDADGTSITLSVVDPATAESIAQALAALSVTWDLTGGDVVQVSDQIAMYHADGMGFGVLVKLYSMAAESQAACETQADPVLGECGVSVEELVAEFRAGSGMGQLFKKYTKPAHLRVGHIRKAFKQSAGAAQEPPVDSTIGTDDGAAGTEPSLSNGNQAPNTPVNQHVVKDKNKDKKEHPAGGQCNPRSRRPRCP